MSSEKDLVVTYGLEADFYRLWLDKRMAYTCANYDEDASKTLEQAQTDKLNFLADYAKVKPDTRVLDIGCGWGSCIEFLGRERAVKEAVGITYSNEQHEDIQRRNVNSNVRSEFCSYEDYKPKELFDSAISIGMFEHICTPEEARTGENIKKYNKYFKKIHGWTKPGAWFGLQTIITLRYPRGKDLKELDWGTRSIFPGAITPRLEYIVRSVAPYWEIVEVRTRGKDYALTTQAWHQRLVANKELIVKTWGQERYDEYERYLSGCVIGFEKGYLSLAQLALKRL
jgi:cyclopropane-fatty-acyl-phospholipid synthase